MVLKYKSKININDIESILKYNQVVSKEGENLSNLLIKILYESSEVIRKDDKTEKELQEFDINMSIKNMEIIVIRELLYKLKCNCDLKTLAIQCKRQEYEKKEHKFIEFFSPAARIKRNMELNSLIEAENRSKITIKTIMHQLNAVNNAIIFNDVYQNKIDIYNKLTNAIEKDNIRKEIYTSKLDFFRDVIKELNCKFTKLSEIIDLLSQNLNKMIEQKILENFAICELELHKFIIENKDKCVTEYLREYTMVNNTRITQDNKDSLLEKIEKLQIIAEVFKDYISKNYIEGLYNLKFNILSFDINNQTEICTNFCTIKDKYYKETEHYIKIISDKINNINQGISPVAKKLQENNLLKKTIKSLNPYFKSFDGKYRYVGVIKKTKSNNLVIQINKYI